MLWGHQSSDSLVIAQRIAAHKVKFLDAWDYNPRIVWGENLQRTLHLTTQMGSCKKVWHWTITMNILMTGAVHMINIYRILMDLCIPSFFQIESYLILFIYIYMLFYGLSGVSKKIMYFRVFHTTWRFLKWSVGRPHLFRQVVPRNCGKWRTTWDSCQRVWCSRRIGSLVRKSHCIKQWFLMYDNGGLMVV